MGNDWLDHIDEARTPEQRAARAEEWVDQRHGDLRLEYEAPPGRRERIFTRAAYAVGWTTLIGLFIYAFVG